MTGDYRGTVCRRRAAKGVRTDDLVGGTGDAGDETLLPLSLLAPEEKDQIGLLCHDPNHRVGEVALGRIEPATHGQEELRRSSVDIMLDTAPAAEAFPTSC